MATATSSPTLLPKGSLVLVTGLNGLIATHVADALLGGGYRVRGTVRSLSRASWLGPLFEARHGATSKALLEVIQVPDLHAPDAWEAAFADGKVAGLASVASGSSMSLNVQDVEGAVREELHAYVGLLEAAKRAGSVKSVVFTSSAWAAYTPEPGVAGVLTAESWNERATQLVADPSLPSEARGFFGVMVMKVRYEQAIWDWVRRERPGFAFNAILPDTVLGPIPDASAQGGSTAGMVRWLWEGKNLEVLKAVAPQWYVDGRDLGKLYLAALVTPGLDGQRIFGFAGRYSWPRVLEILKELHPEREGWAELPDAGWDVYDCPTKEAEDLLKTVNGGKGWISLEDSVRDGLESFRGHQSGNQVSGNF